MASFVICTRRIVASLAIRASLLRSPQSPARRRRLPHRNQNLRRRRRSSRSARRPRCSSTASCTTSSPTPSNRPSFSKPSGDKPGRFILLDPQHRDSAPSSPPTSSPARWTSSELGPGSRRTRSCKFAANPEFKESFESGSGKLVLRVIWRPTPSTRRRPSIRKPLAEYREFLDWYAQLNTLLSAGPPPEPRLRLNEALARHKVIPLKVELTRAGEKEPIRAEHQFTWRLSQRRPRADRRRPHVAGQLPRSVERGIPASDAAGSRR